MSFLPSTIVVLKDDLTEEQSNQVLAKLEKLKGVANAHFKDAVKKNVIEVALALDSETLKVSAAQQKAVEQQAKKIPGVAKVGYSA